MNFDFGNEPGNTPDQQYYIADNRKNAIDSAMMPLGKATQSWENNSKNEDIIYAIVDATAKADFHKKKGYLCCDENAIVYEKEIFRLFSIEESIREKLIAKKISLYKGVLIEFADRYIYLTQHSCKIAIPIEKADRSMLTCTKLDGNKPVFAFQMKTKLTRGNYKNFKVSKMPEGCDYLYEFRGVYDTKGIRLSDYGAL